MRPAAPRLLQDGLAATAAASPAKTAVVAEDGTATFGEIFAAAESLAASLQERGLERGDRVVLYMENSVACTTAVHGVLLAGGTFVTVNPQMKADWLTSILDDSAAKFLISEGPIARTAADARDAAACTPVLVAARARDYVRDAVDFAELTRRDAAPENPGTVPTDLAALLYTSGSTGTPKGVMLTHQGMVFVVDSIAESLRLGPDERILNVLPLAFGYGLTQWLLTARLGGTLLLERSFAYPAHTLARIEREEPTVLPGVPTVFATLASAFGSSGRTYPTVRAITNAASALPAALHEPMRKLFPNALIYRMYGQTECIRVCCLAPELLDVKPTSVGKAIPGTEAFVLDEHGFRAPPGQVGVLHVRGPHVTPGYWNAPDLTAQLLGRGSFDGDRVLCTHDLFTVDEDGDLYIVSRSDEIIKTRGEKVSPIHVENVIFSISGVKEAAVVGVPDDRLGEAIRAYVVRDESGELDAAAVLRVCRERLEGFAVPHEVRFIDDLPKTPSGKVRRRDLLS